MDYYFVEAGRLLGPVPAGHLAEVGVTLDTLVWRKGMSDWKPAREVALVRAALGSNRSAMRAAGLTLAPYGPSTPRAGAPPRVLISSGPVVERDVVLGDYRPDPFRPALPPSAAAVISFIMGIASLVGLFTCFFGSVYGLIGVPVALVAVVLGHIARRKARWRDAGGAKLAFLGLFTGYIALLALGGLYILLTVVLPW